MKTSLHKPVLLKESIDLLKVRDGNYVDCTLGGAGHTKEILKKMNKGKLVCLDADDAAIKRFEKYLEKNGWEKKKNYYQKGNKKVYLVRENFSKLSEVLKELNISNVSGIIADLGMSSDQIEEKERGFSYGEDGPLDMRYDKRLSVTAEDLVNGLYENELEKLFRSQDEKFAKRIAKQIVIERKKRKIQSTLHLVQIIKNALPRGIKGGSYSNKPYVGAYWRKPVMRVFQALRIAVNSELSSLQILLPQALEILSIGEPPASSQGKLNSEGGRFVIISFHSGEDRIIKNFFRENFERIKIFTKKPVRPSMYEKSENLRARSAKLRAYQKIK